VSPAVEDTVDRVTCLAPGRLLDPGPDTNQVDAAKDNPTDLPLDPVPIGAAIQYETQQGWRYESTDGSGEVCGEEFDTEDAVIEQAEEEGNRMSYQVLGPHLDE
jgi:hypothetical protein